MENWIYPEMAILMKAILTVGIIFSVMIIITRLFGLRTFAKMSSFDFASTIAIGSILASVVMNANQSFLKASVALIGILLFQTLFSYLVRKSNFFKNLATNRPMMLMFKGKILYPNLEKTNVGESDLMAKLREANVIQLDEVLAVVLESTGDMSVLHSSEKNQIAEKLIEGVEGIPKREKKGRVLKTHLLRLSWMKTSFDFLKRNSLSNLNSLYDYKDWLILISLN